MSVSNRLPDAERVSTTAWRVGVFVTLLWTTMLTISMASQMYQDLHPVAGDVISGSITVGFALMTCSLLLSGGVAVWGRTRGDST